MRPLPALLILGMILFTVLICRLHYADFTPNKPVASVPSQSTAPNIDARPLHTVVVPNPTAILDEWTRQIIADIELDLNSTNEADRAEITTRLFPMLFSRAPAVAASLAQTVEPVSLREELLRQVARSWSQYDPAQALEWASNLNDPGERENTLTLVCSGVAQTDPLAAMEDAQRTGLDQNTGAIESLVQVWASHDLEGAVAWTKQLPASDTRDQMIARLAFDEVQTDPARAANLVAEQIPAGSIQDESAISVLHQWALRDAEAAAIWLQQFPPGTLRDRGERELAGITAVTIQH
ncbi:MAG TPA: hypothetical protein VE344_01495 [Methylomirabilota bacterium]|nr:hypothetical protein [Methylomirabilota bacterium]